MKNGIMNGVFFLAMVAAANFAGPGVAPATAAGKMVHGAQKKWGKRLMACGRDLVLAGAAAHPEERVVETFMVGDLFEQFVERPAQGKVLAESCAAELEASKESALRKKWLDYFAANPNGFDDYWQLRELFPHAGEIVSSFAAFGAGYTAGSCWMVGPEIMLAFGKGFTAGMMGEYCRTEDGRQWFGIAPAYSTGNGVGATFGFYVGGKVDLYVRHQPGVDPWVIRDDRNVFTGALGVGLHYPADQGVTITPAIGLGGYYGNEGATANVKVVKLKLARKWLLKKLLSKTERSDDGGRGPVDSDDESVDELP